ncbi:MAG: hypothetical protein ACOY94_09090 [Bacillota bacterium]
MAQHEQITRLIDKVFGPLAPGSGISFLPSARGFGVETCLNQVLTSWPFSEDVLVNVVREQGAIWMNVQVYATVGDSFRPVVLFDSMEPCDQMSRQDIIHMIGALVSEIESELDQLRREGVRIATSKDLQQAWETPL